MAADGGAIDHVLPIIGEPEIDKSFQQGIPDTLLSPSSETHVNGIPLAVALVHVTPGTTDTQNIQHTIKETPIVLRRA
ncbi:hypothetical protein Acid7E03_44690 [Acidisoma sp. 7E03]